MKQFRWALCALCALCGCDELANLLPDAAVDAGPRADGAVELDEGVETDVGGRDGEIEKDGGGEDAGRDAADESDAAEDDAACRQPPHYSYTIDSTAIPPGERALYPATGRRCRSDLFLVDVPLALAGVPNLCNDLQGELDGLLTLPFFTADDDGDGTTNGDEWFATDPGRAWVQNFRPGVAGDRHCIVSFSRERNGPRSTIRDQAQCDVLATIRAALMNITNAAGDPIGPELLVTRECDARTQADPWFYEAIGLEAGVEDGGDGVTIAVVDTRIDCEAFPGAADTDACHDPMQRPPRHGTSIGALVQNVAPNANLLFYAGLSEPVGGPISGVARAIHAALDNADEDESLVINLSLGWPPEMGIESTLTGSTLTQHAEAYLGPFGANGQCVIVEDPVGESTRRAIQRAANRETTAVVAAAGNRSARYTPAAFPVDPALYNYIHDGRLPSCVVGPLTPDVRHQLTFFPAAWAEPVSCTGDPDAQSLLIAVDQYGLPESPGMDGFARAALRAPGRGINSTMKVGDDEWSFVVSGTSAAAGIASGLTARVIADTGMSLPFAEIQRLVAAQGEPYSRDDEASLRLTMAEAPDDDWMAVVDDPPGPACRDEMGTYPDVEMARVGMLMALPMPRQPWPDVYAVGTVSPQPVLGCTDDCLVLIKDWDLGAEATAFILMDAVSDMQGALQLVISSKSDEWRVAIGGKAFWEANLKTLVPIQFDLPSSGTWETLDFRVEGEFYENNKVDTFISDDLPAYLDD